MSEFEPKNIENRESQIDAGQFEKAKEHIKHHHEAQAEKAEVLKADQVEKRVESAYKHHEKPKQAETKVADSPLYSHTDFKGHAKRQVVKRTQKKLKPADRAFSKLIHQPAVEVASDIGGATVARPSGLLIGGLFSVLSSLAVLYICRHYGYEYNFMIGSACFIGGFAVGILGEGVGKLFRFRRASA